MRGEVDQAAAKQLGICAGLHIHGLDAHALTALGAQAFVVDKHKGLADGRHSRAWLLENLNRAHGGVRGFEQVARDLGPCRHARLDALCNLRARGKRVLERQQRDADIRVCRGLANDDVAAQHHCGVGVTQQAKDLINLNPAHGARLLRDVGHDVVAAARCEQLGRWRAAAFGHVTHVGRAREANVAGEKWHVQISKKLKVGRNISSLLCSPSASCQIGSAENAGARP